MSVYAKGINGQVTVDGDWLTIHRKGLGRLGHSKGDRRIPLAQITAVQMRPAGPLINGFLRVTIPGAPVARGGLGNAEKDENAVIFRKSHQAEFDQVRAAIEAYIARQHAPRPSPSSASRPGGVAAELAQLAELHQAGVLTDGEFEAAKARALGGGRA